MAEPTLSRRQALIDLAATADSLRRLGYTALAESLDAIAAWLAAACVVEHEWQGGMQDRAGVQYAFCGTCGQRRDVTNA